MIHTTLDFTLRFSLEYTNAWLIILCWWVVTNSGLNSSPVWWVHLTLGLWPRRNSILKRNCIDMVYTVLMERYSPDLCSLPSCATMTNQHFVIIKDAMQHRAIYWDESKHKCGQIKHTLKLVNHVDYNRLICMLTRSLTAKRRRCVEIVILNAMCLWPCWWHMNKLRRLEAFALSPLDISWCVLYDCVKYFHDTRRVTSKHTPCQREREFKRLPTSFVYVYTYKTNKPSKTNRIQTDRGWVNNCNSN